MANELQGIWTQYGKEREAAGRAGGSKLQITHAAVGSGLGAVPLVVPSQTALKEEVWRGPVNGVQVNPDDATDVIVDVVLPNDIGGFYIREWGLFDDAGKLIAVGPHSEMHKPVITSGQAVEFLERFHLPVADSGAINLTIASQALASQNYVRSKVAEHDADVNAHDFFVLKTRKINTAAPLTGGGDLSADRTLGLAGFAVQAGMPIMTTSAKLEHNCVWPDGSLVLFDDWPDLQARYAAGYIVALAVGSTPAAIAAYPGRFVAHASGLYLPSLGGLFPRPWTPSQTQDAGRGIGSLQSDAVRKQAGTVGVGMDTSAGLTTCTPPFSSDGDSGGRTVYTAGGTYKGYVIRYDNSLGGNPTSTENRPQNYAQPVQIYLGRHKTEV